MLCTTLVNLSSLILAFPFVRITKGTRAALWRASLPLVRPHRPEPLVVGGRGVGRAQSGAVHRRGARQSAFDHKEGTVVYFLFTAKGNTFMPSKIILLYTKIVSLFTKIMHLVFFLRFWVCFKYFIQGFMFDYGSCIIVE